MIEEQLAHIHSTLPEHVTLVAVSKTKPKDAILTAYEAGQRVFGENRVKELKEKWEVLPKDIEWHMIGHLQRKSVKYIAPFVHLIHGVDSYSLLKEINKQVKKHDRIQDVLLQFHIATEDTKFGFSKDELKEMMNDPEFNSLGNIRIRGVMGMATFTSDMRQVREEFHDLKKIFEELKRDFFDSNFDIISMGMSGDYQIAIEQGSTMVRIGSSIFGSRN